MLLLVSISAGPQGLRAEPPREWTQQHLSELVELYRYFHQHPELSFQEEQTAARLAEELDKLGTQVTRHVGGHGVVALLPNGTGPTVMIRTDLDALPVTEQTGLVYSSQVRVRSDDGQEVGVMHACGHDMHLTCLVGTARYLAGHRDAWSGTLMLIGQPAEERGAGALAMLKDGLFERFPRPDAALALHVAADLAAGKVAFRAGYTAANVDSVDVTMKGRGGHGAYPHMTIDPIVEAAELVLALQTIVSREVDPTQSAVITVGSIHGGTKHNVIGDSCHLQLTVRSYSDTVRRQLLAGIERKAKAVAAGAGAPEPDIQISEGTPALVNDEALAARMADVFHHLLGPENIDVPQPQMGGEDFSQFGRAGLPVFMFSLGTVEPQRLERFRQLGQSPPSLHSPLYYPDAEPSLMTGVTAMSSAALAMLRASAADGRSQ
jgi:hippurate hydrolase